MTGKDLVVVLDAFVATAVLLAGITATGAEASGDSEERRPQVATFHEQIRLSELRGNFEEAIAACTKLLELEHSNPLACALRGSLAAGLQPVKDGSQDLQAVLDMKIDRAERRKLVDELLSHSLALAKKGNEETDSSGRTAYEIYRASHAIAKYAMEHSILAYGTGIERHDAVAARMTELICLLRRDTWRRAEEIAVRWDTPAFLSLDLAFAANCGNTVEDTGGLVRAIRSWLKGHPQYGVGLGSSFTSIRREPVSLPAVDQPMTPKVRTDYRRGVATVSRCGCEFTFWRFWLHGRWL